MNIETILQLFCRLSGLDTAAVSENRFLCETALDLIQSRLDPEADLSGCGSRLNYAAAALAYYRYVLKNLTDGDLSEIKVGEISAKSSASREAEAAEKLCKDAFDGIRSLLQQEGFVFTSVS